MSSDFGPNPDDHDCGQWRYYDDLSGGHRRACPHYDMPVPDPEPQPEIIRQGGRLAGEMVVRAGKWRGHSLAYVYEQDPNWVRWLAAIDPHDYGAPADWSAMRDAARALIRSRVGHSGVECHWCHKELRFRDVVIITKDTLGVACQCRPNDALRVDRASHPAEYVEMVERLLSADGFQGIAIPYVSAEYPPLPCPEIDVEANALALAMVDVDDVVTFMERCARDHAE